MFIRSLKRVDQAQYLVYISPIGQWVVYHARIFLAGSMTKAARTVAVELSPGWISRICWQLSSPDPQSAGKGLGFSSSDWYSVSKLNVRGCCRWWDRLTLHLVSQIHRSVGQIRLIRWRGQEWPNKITQSPPCYSLNVISPCIVTAPKSSGLSPIPGIGLLTSNSSIYYSYNRRMINRKLSHPLRIVKMI